MKERKREVCFLIGKGGAILFADSSDSPTAINDSQRRWKMIWKLRKELEEISHSHPVSAAEFSQIDKTTMSALSEALGKTIRFSVVSAEVIKVSEGGQEYILTQEPWWSGLMRSASGMTWK